MSAGKTERSYIAFISYRHRPLDKAAAAAIQRSIEHYRVPKEYRELAGGKRLGMVFRDEDELTASASLSASITYALEHSKFLLVICTPDMPASRWCQEEIKTFIRLHGRERVLAVLTDGGPEESFSPYLVHTFDEEGRITGDVEPLAANIAGKNHTIDRRAYRKEMVRIYAALLGCPFDALWQRTRRQQALRAAILLGVGFAVTAGFLGLTLSKNAEITRQNAEITRQNTEITRQNLQITTQQRELRRQLSESLTDLGFSQLEEYDLRGAIQSGAAALLSPEQSALYDRRAEMLLTRALGAYQYKSPQSSLLYRQNAEIASMSIDASGRYLLTADWFGAVRCVSTDDGTLLWETSSSGSTGGIPPVEVLLAESRGAVLCKSQDEVVARSMESGAVLWQYRYVGGRGDSFRLLSPDGGLLLLIEKSEDRSDGANLLVLDTADGAVLTRMPLEAEGQRLALYTSLASYYRGGGFSPSGRYCAAAVHVEAGQEDTASGAEPDGFLRCCVFDTRDWSLLYSREFPEPSYARDLFYGLEVDENGDLLLARHLSYQGGIQVSSIRRDGGAGQVFIAHTLEDYSGMMTNLMDYRSVLPMVTSDHLAVVGSGRFVYVVSLGEELSVRRSFGFTGDILHLSWADRERELLRIYTGDGAFALYDLSHEEDAALEMYSVQPLDQTGIVLLFPIPGGEDQGRCVTVPDGQKGRIIKVDQVSDPHARVLPGQEGLSVFNADLQLSPSGKRFFAFYGSTDLTAVCYDAHSLEELERAVFPGVSGSAAVLDENRFICGGRLCSMDGRAEPLEGLDEGANSDYKMESIRLSDGQILTFADESGSFFPKPCALWLDGKRLAAWEDPASALVFDYNGLEDLTLCGSGYVVGRGRADHAGGAGEEDYTSQTEFAVLSVHTGERTFLPDPEQDFSRMAGGTERPLLACSYKSGRLSLIRLDSGERTELDGGYGPGEVRGLCFSPGDDYLLLITGSGRLDVWSAASQRQVCSLEGALSSGAESVEELRCRRDGTHLHIFASGRHSSYGTWLNLDADAWTLTAESGSVFDCFPEVGQVLALREGQILSFPLYTEDMLRQWAQQG